jgi:hypothetical protein
MGVIQTNADNVATLLSAVTGIGRVEKKRGGVAGWVRNPRPSVAHWEIDVTRVEEVAAGIGGADFRFHTVIIEGWMPFSYDNPDTTPTWRNLVDSVCDKMRANMSLNESTNDASPPLVAVMDYQQVSGEGTQGGAPAQTVLCHHARLEIRVRQFLTFTTT